MKLSPDRNMSSRELAEGLLEGTLDPSDWEVEVSADETIRLKRGAEEVEIREWRLFHGFAMGIFENLGFEVDYER